MAKIITQCEHCQQKMNVDEEFVGKKIRCPNCKNTFPITEFNAKPAAAPQEKPKTETQKRAASSSPFSTGAQKSVGSGPFAREEEEIEEIKETFDDFETTKEAKSPSYAAESVKTYPNPKLGVFKGIVPSGAKIVGEYNLGCSGWIVPESTKVLLTENEVYVSNSRRYIFGIFPGGKKLASYPIEFQQMRTGMLKYTSLFAALLFLIFGLAIGLGAWFVAKTAGVYEETNKMYCLTTMFDFSTEAESQEKLSKIDDAATEDKTVVDTAKADSMNEFWDKAYSFVKMAWYYLIPFVIALIWVLIFWKSIYKTCLFTVSISRFRKKETQACLRKINEQALRIQR